MFNVMLWSIFDDWPLFPMYVRYGDYSPQCPNRLRDTLMTDDEFLNAAIRFEKSDKVMREKKLQLHKSKDKRKSDSTSSLSRNDQSRNQSGAKKRHTDSKEKNGTGVALYCALCKEAGAPQWVYQNHNTNNCRKKEKHKRKLSGGSSSKSSFQQNMKKELRRTMKKKYQKLKHSTRELCVSRKNTKGNTKKNKRVSTYSSSEESDVISEESDIESE